ncbi:MAG TPA: alpha amylase C-terminal domain-containing protein, partial [Anaerolineae bacterium]
QKIIVACNFTPVVRHNYRLGVPDEGTYYEHLNSDAEIYGGSNVLNPGPIVSTPDSWHNQPHSIELTLPPLAAVFLKRDDASEQ